MKPPYLDTLAGLTATSDGEAFAVDDGDGSFTIYLNDDGVAVAHRRQATMLGLASAMGGAIAGNGAAAAASDASTADRPRIRVEDYGSIQQAFDAASTRGADLHFRAGKTYAWPISGVSVDRRVKVVATGARIEIAAPVTALTFNTGADGSEVDGGQWVYTGPTIKGYSAGSNAIRVSGTRNGARSAPTFIQNVWIRNAIFDGFGNIAVEWRFARHCGDENLRCLKCGYAGVYCYSVETYRSTRLFVSTLAGQLDTGQPSTSELNAYGFTATALTGGTPDRIRDPYSRDIVVDSPTIRNVPTWHAIDSHGSDAMVVRNATITDCRRGVVFTGLSDRGTTNSAAIGCTATNNFSASDTNANGSPKKGEAFWDVGPSSAHRNRFNSFPSCTAFGHGNPVSDDGAITIGNADDGTYNIWDEQSQRVGWRIGSNVARATIDAQTTNVRHATINPSVARIEGHDIGLRIVRWRSGERDASIDKHVMVNGLIVAYTNTNAAISFGDFDLTDCTAGEVLSSRGVKIAARLSGLSR